jgi:phosphopantetheinyl transferase
MPLANSISIPQGGELILWKVDEEKDWFIERLNLSSKLWAEYSMIDSEPISLRWLSSRYALQVASKKSPLHFNKARSGKPFFEEGGQECSLSHCMDFVAAIYGEKPVGIDVERTKRPVNRIQHYFLNPDEIRLFEDLEIDLIVAWSAKESIFKCLGITNLDFKSQIKITEINNIDQVLEFQVSILNFEKTYQVPFLMDTEKVLTWVIGS